LDGAIILWFRTRLEFGKSCSPAGHFEVLVDLTGFTGSDRFVGSPETKLGPPASELKLNAVSQPDRRNGGMQAVTDVTGSLTWNQHTTRLGTGYFEVSSFANPIRVMSAYGPGAGEQPF
jgi:hypothetical protein